MCDKTGVDLDRLRLLMDNSGKTRQEIAQDFGCDTSTITKHYNGVRGVTTDYLIKYAEYFKVSADYLLGLQKDATTDKDEKFINTYTGLSAAAVDYLHRILPYQDKSNYSCCAVIDVLNDLLSNSSMVFEDICMRIMEYYYVKIDYFYTKRMFSTTYESDTPKERQLGLRAVYQKKERMKYKELRYLLAALELLHTNANSHIPDTLKAPNSYKDIATYEKFVMELSADGRLKEEQANEEWVDDEWLDELESMKEEYKQNHKDGD